MGDLSRSEPDRVLYSPFITSRLSPVSLSFIIIIIFILYYRLYYPVCHVFPVWTSRNCKNPPLFLSKISQLANLWKQKTNSTVPHKFLNLFYFILFFLCVEILLLLLARSVTRVKERMSIPSQFFFIFKFFKIKFIWKCPPAPPVLVCCFNYVIFFFF